MDMRRNADMTREEKEHYVIEKIRAQNTKVGGDVDMNEVEEHVHLTGDRALDYLVAMIATLDHDCDRCAGYDECNAPYKRVGRERVN